MRFPNLLDLAAALLEFAAGFDAAYPIRRDCTPAAANCGGTHRHVHHTTCGEVPLSEGTRWVRTANHRVSAFDRTWRDDDGACYYGVDNDDGTTDWYNGDGSPEGRTDTPSAAEQDENDARNDGYDAACPHCRGTGYDPLDGGQCEHCGGTGEPW